MTKLTHFDLQGLVGILFCEIHLTNKKYNYKHMKIRSLLLMLFCGLLFLGQLNAQIGEKNQQV